MQPLSYRSPKTEMRESPIHGRGLFAKEKIAKDEIVMIKGGHIVSREVVQELQQTLGPVEIQIADEFFIAPVTAEEREGSMLYSNHSCDSNLGLRGEITFVAMREIAAGEELTHDWAMTDNDDTNTVCRCGARNCRGTVTGKDWQRPEVQRQYSGYFSAYLLEKMRTLSVVMFFALSAAVFAQEEAVMEEVIVEAPFDVRLELPKEAHVQSLLEHLLLKAETERALELQLANRNPLTTILDLTKYIPYRLGPNVDTFMFENFTRADLNPSKRNPLLDP